MIRLNLLNTEDKRSIKVGQNVIASAIFKVIDVIVYLVLVPVTIGYLNPYEYGIWITLSSILMWINSFDIGLGNGLRNKLASAIAKNDIKSARMYISTTLFMLTILMISFVAIGMFVILFVDWYKLLNTTSMEVPNLILVFKASYIIFCINFVLRVINNVYQGLQLPAVANFFAVSGHVFALVVITVLTYTTAGNLLYVAITYSISATIVYLIAYPYTFLCKYKYLKPSFATIDYTKIKDICSLSLKFFILQIAGLIIFSSTNILVSNMFGPESVTPYNLSNRYFSLVNIGFSILIAPMWTAATDAYEKKDIKWIKNTMKRINIINLCASLILVGMLILSPIAYSLWLGDAVEIPFMLSTLMSIYVCIIMWSLSYSSFLNGMGLLNIQLITTSITAILFIPLCRTLGNLMGIEGVLLSLILLNISGLLLNVCQFYKVVSGNATKKWLK